MRILALGAALLIAFVPRTAEAAADNGVLVVRERRRSKSHRTRTRKAPKARAKTGPVAPAPWKPKVRRLKPGRWSPEVSFALERLLEFEGEGTPGYTPMDPPIVIVAWDHIAMTNHLGEAVFYRLVADAGFKFDDAFWELVPLQYGRARIRAGYEGFRDRPKAIWPKESYYRMYRKAFLRCYQRICSEVGGRECSDWLVKLLAGFAEPDLRSIIRETLETELRTPVGPEAVGEGIEDPDPVVIQRGLRSVPEMEDLVRTFRDKGFDIWTVSTGNEWAVGLAAGLYGIDPTRILGIRSKVSKGLLTTETLIPITFGSGKAAALSMFVARTPALIAAGPEDEILLKYGRGVRIVVGDPGEKRGGWTKLGWLFQKSFSPVRAPQRIGEEGNIVPFEVSNPGG